MSADRVRVTFRCSVYLFDINQKVINSSYLLFRIRSQLWCWPRKAAEFKLRVC